MAKFRKLLVTGAMGLILLAPLPAQAAIPVIDDNNILQQIKTYTQTVEVVKNTAEQIRNQLRELQVDLRSNPAVFIGGGSLLLRPFLEASPLVAKADFVESPNANALGYEMLGRVQLSHRPA